MLSKPLIQFSIEGKVCAPSLLFDLRPNYGGGHEDNGDLLQKVPCPAACRAPNPCSRPPLPMPPPGTPGHSQASLGQSLVGSLQYSCLENPMNSIKRQKDMTLKDELPRSAGVPYATGDQWRNNSRKSEETEPKQKQCPVVDVTGNGSKSLML